MAKAIFILILWMVICFFAANITGCAVIHNNPPPNDLGRDAVIYNGVVDLLDLLSGAGD